MRTTQAKRLVTLRAICDFLDEHADRLPGVNESNARRRLDALVEQIHESAAEQEASALEAQGETQRYQALRLILVQNHMAPVVAVAQSVLVADPALRVYVLPRGNPSPGKLMAMGGGLATAATPHREAFIEAGLAEDFLEQLRAAAEAMLASNVRRVNHGGRRRKATTGIDTYLRQAKTLVRVIGLMVRTKAAGDVALLAGWDAIVAPRRLTATATLTALPAPAPMPALANKKMKQLASGATPAEDSAEPEDRTVGSLFRPLRRLIRGKSV